jgi:cytochrome c oxidase subunit 3
MLFAKEKRLVGPRHGADHHLREPHPGPSSRARGRPRTPGAGPPYSVYRYRFPAAFHKGASDEIVPLGAANTAILITGSLLISFSLTAVRRGKRRLATALQAATVLLGGVFLAIEIHEWLLKIAGGIYPNGPALKGMLEGEILYFGLYYVMTGLHGLHVLVGITVISVMIYFTGKGIINRENFLRLENTALFWHFVDIIWLYLFPLFYLIT